MSTDHSTGLQIAVATHRPSAPVRIQLRGELDESTCEELALVMARSLEADTALLVVDLSALRFMDLAGARLLGAAAGVLRQRDAALLLLFPRSGVARALQAIGLLDLVRGAAGLEPAMLAAGRIVLEPAPSDPPGVLAPSLQHQAELIIHADRADARDTAAR